MSASRTLRRKQPRLTTEKRTKPGTFNRRHLKVVRTPHPSRPGWVIERTWHATKGFRVRAVPA